MKKADLVIFEDGRPHQANSVRTVPASVLIAMDTGGEIRQKKSIATTRLAAENLVSSLRDATTIALMQFHDRVEFLSDWSTDRKELLQIIGSRTGFGRRSSLSGAVTSAVDYFANAPSENRHLILITDGLDTPEDKESRSQAVRRLWESGIIVHVISYTQIEYEALKPMTKIWRDGEENPKRMPDEVMESLACAIPVRKILAKDVLRQIYQPRLFSVLIDIPFIKNRREHLRSLATSQLQLSVLASYTGGELLLPGSLAEIVDQAANVSHIINSQYVLAYSLKRPLRETSADEIRQIDVSSRRPDLTVRASRRLVVFAREQPK
ncbi:MAG: VWA domain-containing protein [Pyrinomonadaceae bacterium]